MNQLLRSITEQYAALPQVEAVALGGSRGAGSIDQDSDSDIYVYSRAEIPINERGRIAHSRSDHPEVDNRFWEPGDEWIERDSGAAVDVMFRDVAWIEDQLDRVLNRHLASVGYSTCFWHNVLHSQILFDRAGWFEQLQQAAERPYPEPLRVAIVRKNHPILRSTQSSYLHQIQKAARRGDLISVQHRTTVLLSSYFDILFAVNRQPHPGEKRLLQRTIDLCEKRPPNMAEQVGELIRSIGHADVVRAADDLIENLDRLLESEKLLQDIKF